MFKKKKRRSHLKRLKKFASLEKKKKNALVDTRSNLYLIQRFLCVPLEGAHVPLVVRVPHFENHCSRVLSNGQSFENAVDVEDYNAIRARSSTEELNHSGLYK